MAFKQFKIYFVKNKAKKNFKAFPKQDDIIPINP